jgi:hypothetical protein
VISNGLSNTSAPSTYFPLSSTAPGANTTHPVDPGAVLGLFTYTNDANESDIEILTRDPLNRIRYMNQPSDNDIDSTDAYLAPGEAWTEWLNHRIDWFPSVSRWYVDDFDSPVLNKSVNVPTEPSGLIMNLLSNGGEWSGNMSVGATVMVVISLGSLRHYAMKHPLRGLTHGDNWSTLEKRLTVLPSGIEELYTLMWKRLNDDRHVYEAEAALFFKLVLGSEHLREGQLSLLRLMMIMTDKDVVGIYLEEGDSMTSKELIKRCQETQRRILTRCAGLLEVVDNGGRQKSSKYECRRDQSKLSRSRRE